MLLVFTILSAILGDPTFFAPPMTKAQEALVAKLGDPVWRTREDATKELGKMEFDGLRAFYAACRSEDPEIASRGDRLLARYYCCLNSKREMPPIHGLYEMESFKLKSGRMFDVPTFPISEIYTEQVQIQIDFAKRYNQYFDPSCLEMQADNYCTRSATFQVVRRLRMFGYTRAEVTEILDKMTEAADGKEIGQEGWRKFRLMQGLPEYPYHGFFRLLMPFGGIKMCAK